jgi:hypothetical protein
MALDDELNDGTNELYYFPDVLFHGVVRVFELLIMCV